MDGVVEIITGRERRRRWSVLDKVRLVAETNEPGSTIRAVAARHGVSESLLFTWRRQAREGLLAQGPDNLMFMPVQRCRRSHQLTRRRPAATRRHALPRRSGALVRPVSRDRVEQRATSAWAVT
jgi:transposase-like protein